MLRSLKPQLVVTNSPTCRLTKAAGEEIPWLLNFMDLKLPWKDEMFFGANAIGTHHYLHDDY
jgi:hypothetical protein